MRNIKSNDFDCFQFHKEVVASKKATKNDPKYKDRVSLLNNEIEKLHKSFNDAFAINKIEIINSYGFFGQNKLDLLSLYSYKLKIIQKLKNSLTTSETGRIINTCQNCTINEINSFDHFAPKTDFPEYSVNPKNLFPSCTQCNSLKSKNWRNGTEKLFLNLYLDKLPEKQYLFVDIDQSKGVISTKFNLKNVNGIDPKLFSLIQFHYDKLSLFQRFSENNDLVITPLEISISKYLGKLPLEEIKKTQIEISIQNQAAFGFNHWKSILEMSLLNNTNFMSQFEKI